MAVRPSNKLVAQNHIVRYDRPPVGTDAKPLPGSARDILRLPQFVAKCKELGVEPTRRQAAKFNAGTGRWGGVRLVRVDAA